MDFSRCSLLSSLNFLLFTARGVILGIEKYTKCCIFGKKGIFSREKYDGSDVSFRRKSEVGI